MALSRFISKSAETNLPFFKILRKGTKFEWTKECEEALENLKKYLLSPPLLSKPLEAETLYLYLATTDEAMSSVLVRIQDNEHLPIYYLSKALAGSEARYVKVEKLAFAMVYTARRLKPYFKSHRIVVLTNEPLKHVLDKPDQSGRLSKWAIY